MEVVEVMCEGDRGVVRVVCEGVCEGGRDGVWRL